MKKIFTPTERSSSEKKQKEVVAPSTKTLDFLKQFARVHHIEKALPDTMNVFCVN